MCRLSLLLLAAATALLPASASAAPRWLRLSWTGPTDTTATVTWTDDAAGSGTLEFRPVGATASQQVVASSTTLAEGVLGATFTAKIEGLAPDSEYEYRVESKATWSGWKRFRTAPPARGCAPVRLVATGDSRGEEPPVVGYQPSPQWADIVAAIAQENPHVVLHTGDFVRTGTTASHWAKEMPRLQPLSSSTPFFMVMGNHDIGPRVGAGANFNGLFENATEAVAVDDYFATVIGNVLVVGLSTYTFSMDSQIEWLRTVLETHRRGIDWRVVFFHTPVYSSGHHGNNEGDRARAERLVPLLDEYGVDVVFNGHDHDYERYHPSRGGWGGVPRVITPLAHDGGRRGTAQGTVYIVTGGGGALQSPTFSANGEGSAFGAARLHYVVADAAGPRMTLTVRDCGAQGLGGPKCSGALETIVLEKAEPKCGGAGPDAGIPVGAASGADAAPVQPFDVDAATAADPDAEGPVPAQVEPADGGTPSTVAPEAAGCGCGAASAAISLSVAGFLLGGTMLRRRS